MAHGKRYNNLTKKVDRTKTYNISDAVKQVKQLATAKFDESVDIAINLGIDPRKADQAIRGTVALPHGIGKTVHVTVVTKNQDAAAREAGAKARLSLEITITPAGEGVGGEPLFKVTGKVKRTLPEKPEPSSNFFVDDDDNLTPRNPKQQEMKLTALEGGERTQNRRHPPSRGSAF